MRVTIVVTIPNTETVRAQQPRQARELVHYFVTKDGNGVGSAAEPLVIVSGCHNLSLTALVGGNQTIWWSITPHPGFEHDGSAPRLWHDHGRDNVLTTNAVGLYIISAGYIKTPNQIQDPAARERTRLYVHFVSGSVVFNENQPSHTTEADLESPGRISITALFEFNATAQFKCGSAIANTAIANVKVGVIQNVWMGQRGLHELGALYRSKGKWGVTGTRAETTAPRLTLGSRSRTVTTSPIQQPSLTVPQPQQFDEGWLYESFPNAAPPFVDCSDDGRVPFYVLVRKPGSMPTRLIEFSDAPGLVIPPCCFPRSPNKSLRTTFPQLCEMVLKNEGFLLHQVKGHIKFRAAVVAWSRHAPSTFIVLGWIDWSLRLDQDMLLELDKSERGVKLTCGMARDQGTRYDGVKIFPFPVEARSVGIECYGPIAVGDQEDDANYDEYRWDGQK